MHDIENNFIEKMRFHRILNNNATSEQIIYEKASYRYRRFTILIYFQRKEPTEGQSLAIVCWSQVHMFAEKFEQLLTQFRDDLLLAL